MKVLIAIPSCHSLRNFEQAVRNTWGKDVVNADLRFFLGNPKVKAESGEVFLDVGDTLHDLSHKMVEICRWALDFDYDFTFKCDLDTLVRPLRLIQSDFYRYDWVGGQNSFFASGGGGYWLSRKAMKAVLEHKIEAGPAEDVNTAHALLEQGIMLHHDPRFLFIPGETLREDTITYHLSSVKAWNAKATPEDLYAAYNGTFKLPQTEVRRFRRLR
jgi:hypothetical protein